MKRHEQSPQKPSHIASLTAATPDLNWGAALQVPRDPVSDTARREVDGSSERVSDSGQDLLRLYLKEAAQTPLLTSEEEHRLGVLNRAGNEEARQRLIKSNLLLVVSVAKEFTGFGLELSDLIALGNIGLMRAVARFDPDRGAKFATYASFWIKQSIRRGLTDEGATIRVPGHRYQEVRELAKAQRHLTVKLQRDPTVHELSVCMGLTTEQVQARLQTAYVRNTVPLDAPLSEDASDRDGASLYDTVADPNIIPISEAMAQEERHFLVRALSGDKSAMEGISAPLRPLVAHYRAGFKDREIDILTRRFGLGRANGTITTLEDLGQEYDLTRERIRQVEARALRKFKYAFEQIDKARDRETEEVLSAAKKRLASSLA